MQGSSDGLGLPLVLVLGGLAAFFYVANELNTPHDRRCKKKRCKRC